MTENLYYYNTSAYRLLHVNALSRILPGFAADHHNLLPICVFLFKMREPQQLLHWIVHAIDVRERVVVGRSLLATSAAYSLQYLAGELTRS